MEVGEDGIYNCEVYNAVKSNQPSLLRELLTQCDFDFNKYYGEEGNILNVAIENAGLEVLVTLLQVEYSLLKSNIELSREKYELLEKPCSVDQLTPLMQAVRCGNGVVVTFLIKCDVSVNAVNISKYAAIDFVSNGGIALLLFRADSLLHSLRNEEGQRRLEILVSECEELKVFFERRERLHEAIKKGCLDDEVKELIDGEESQYFINSKGETAVWQAAKAVSADVWAYLNVKRLKCAGRSEEYLVKLAKDSYEDRFNRSLLNYFFEVQGTHVMKMIAKSRVFGKKGIGKGGLGKQMKDYYEALAEYEETEILLEVLQDEHDLEVVFDFESDSVKYVCLKCSGDQVWGLTDFHRKRVYVGAKGKSDGGKCHVLGTLSHELTHKALMVVFQNQGRPFSEGDSEAREKYQSILQGVMGSNSMMNCDEVIRRVAEYDESLWEQELIVRVPEIIAKYCPSFKDEEAMGGCEVDVADDGIDLLEAQVEPLLNYYRDHVMTEFRKYVDSIFTSNKMTVKIMSDYQKLLLNSMNESVSMGPEVQDMEKYLYDHNGLKVLLVSCVQLCYAHLKMVHRGRGENVLLVGWSQYNQPNSGYLDGLSNGAFDMLVVRWDVEEEPKFCRRSKCFGDCIGNMFGGLCSRVIVVLTKVPKSLKKVTPLEYVWTDLSDSTKSDVLKKRVNFVGYPLILNDVISEALLEGNSVEDFMREHLLSSDIAFLLKDEVINIGKVTGWAAKDEAELFELKCYMRRHFSQRSISFNESLLFKGSDLLVVSNACVQDLLNLKVSKSFLSVWDPSLPDKNAKCYVLNENVGTDVDAIFCKICGLHSDKKGIHLLELRCGHFLYIKSHGSVENLLGSVNYESEEIPISEGLFLEQKINTVSDKTDIDLSQAMMPVIIADEPGCGKSFIVNNFVSESMKYFSHALVTVVDLNFYAQTRSPLQLGELDSTRTESFEDLIQILFQMVGHGNSSFERSVLKLYCQKACRVIVIFDGFDEICPKYRENVIGFLEALRSKLAIKVCVTTRLHERHKLELKLNAIAYKLIPFSEVEQVDFLCRYWKARLRNYSREERSKKMDNLESGMRKWLMENYPKVFKCEGIEGVQLTNENQMLASGVTHSKNIDFKSFAEKLILSIDHFTDDVNKFTRTPLHIKMVAFVLFEEDFKIGSYWDLGQLYEKFLQIKFDIFEREKVLASGNVSSEKSFGMAKKRIFELLENLSANIFFDPDFFECDRVEMYDALSIGLTLEKEETYQFIHRTFGEFFFAKWLLREAQRESVSKFWLEQLFTDKGLFRVRLFLEDMMNSYYSSMLSDESVANKVPHLSPSVFPDERLSVCLNACLFGIIVEGFTGLLKYFAGVFGSKLINLFMECENFPSGSASSTEKTVNLILQARREKPINLIPEFDIPEIRIYRHPKLIHSVSANRYNAFTLTYRWHSSSIFKGDRRDKTFKFVRMMLALIEQHQMTENLNKVFYEHGFSWITPSANGDDSYRCYFSEVVNFLTGKMAVFKDSLKKAFLNESNIWKNIILQDITIFDFICTLANLSLEESEFERIFLENDDYFKFWLWTVRYANTDNVIKIWQYVKMSLSKEESQSQFLSRYHMDRSDIYRPRYVNVLTEAMLSNDLVRVTLVWELCMEVMDREGFNELFHTSIVDGRPSLEHYRLALPPVIFKFIRAQLIDGHINEDEVVKIIMSKDSNGNCYFLEIQGHDYVLESLFAFHELLAVNLRLKAEEVLMEMEKIYWYLISILGENKYERYNKGIPSDIATMFGEIVSSGKNSLKDQSWTLYDHPGDECLLKYSETPVLMAHLVLIHKYLELVWECKGRELLLQFLKSDHAYSRRCPGILHHILLCEVPHAVGFICAELWKYLGDSYMVDLLFLKDHLGNNVFHLAARKGCVHSWGKFYDVARVLLKESALGDVHSVENENGKYVQDLFPDKRN